MSWELSVTIIGLLALAGWWVAFNAGYQAGKADEHNWWMTRKDDTHVKEASSGRHRGR